MRKEQACVRIKNPDTQTIGLQIRLNREFVYLNGEQIERITNPVESLCTLILGRILICFTENENK